MKDADNGYLVMTVNFNEEIHIGNDVVIVFRRVEHGRVRVAVKAPRVVPVTRVRQPEDVPHE